MALVVVSALPLATTFDAEIMIAEFRGCCNMIDPV